MLSTFFFFLRISNNIIVPSLIVRQYGAAGNRRERRGTCYKRFPNQGPGTSQLHGLHRLVFKHHDEPENITEHRMKMKGKLETGQRVSIYLFFTFFEFCGWKLQNQGFSCVENYGGIRSDPSYNSRQNSDAVFEVNTVF